MRKVSVHGPTNAVRETWAVKVQSLEPDVWFWIPSHGEALADISDKAARKTWPTREEALRASRHWQRIKLVRVTTTTLDKRLRRAINAWISWYRVKLPYLRAVSHAEQELYEALIYVRWLRSVGMAYARRRSRALDSLSGVLDNLPRRKS